MYNTQCVFLKNKRSIVSIFGIYILIRDRPTSVGPEQIREMITKKLGFLSGTCAAPVIPQKHKYSLDEELELEENQVEKKESPPPEPTVASNATVFPPPKEKEDEPSLAI
jgi:hypothetical protein